MDKDHAVRLLDNVFNSAYSHKNYEEFIVNLLNNVKINRKNQNSRIGVDNFFKGFVEDFEYFGTYRDNSGKTADILSIKLARDNSKIRARVKQRNIVAKWLNKSGSNCALVAFYDNTGDWRFSFVEVEYKTIRSEDGKVHDIEDLTPAKRLSFLVGKNEPNHTCKKYLLDFIVEDSKLPDLDSIHSAFGIENVSKEFFDKYKGLYRELFASLEDIVSKDEQIRREFESKSISTSEFAKKLLGQIVFIYFLQKKGWLGVPRNGKWGEGRRDFLRATFNKKFRGYDNFFNDILEPLFYNAFASSERDNDYYGTLDCRIPFLNGGLFEPIGGYDWVQTDITIDNRIFERILDTFDEFNFTIKEDEPLEKEVAVDPEMLGKIFENLLEDNLRKGHGAFYTPREIVHYMCQETLVNYLDDNSGVERSVLDALVRQGNDVIDIPDLRIPIFNHANELDKLLADIRVADPAVGSGAFPVGMLTEIVNARLVLGELMHGEHPSPYQLKRAAIENSLYGIDIDAGAVDIAKLRFWLSLVIDEDNEDHIDPLPNLEQKIMCGNSLLESFHGVKLFDDSLIGKDAVFRTRIDEINDRIAGHYEKMGAAEFGTDTSSLQAEIDTLKKERQDLEHEHSSSGDKGTVLGERSFGVPEVRQHLRDLKALQKEFFNETIKSKKERLRKEINNLEWMFIEDALRAEGHGDEAVEEVRDLRKKRSKPFFLWRLYFSDVFSEKGGFDIVIGNPPYVQIQGMQEEDKVALENEGYETFARTGDLYCLFYERGYELSREGGQTAMITSNQWMRAKYGKKTRKFFKQNTKPLMLMDFNGQQMFETATVDTDVLIFAKEARDENYRMPYAIVEDGFNGSNLTEYVNLHKNEVELKELRDNHWKLAKKEEHELKRKIEKIGTPLKDWDIKINFGIKTGFNQAFIIDEDTKAKLISKDPKSAEIIKPILRGRDIQKYRFEWAGSYLISTFPALKLDIHDYPSVKNYLSSFGKRLEQTGEKYIDENGIENKSRKRTSNKWFETQDTIGYWKEFENEKIIWKRIGSILRFCYSSESIMSLDSTCIATGKGLKYLTAVLNSKLGNYLLQDSPRTGMGDLIISVQALEPIPIPEIPPQTQRPFTTLVNTIIRKKEAGEETTAEETEIDRLVYDLYGLTDDEIRMVNGI